MTNKHLRSPMFSKWKVNIDDLVLTGLFDSRFLSRPNVFINTLTSWSDKSLNWSVHKLIKIWLLIFFVLLKMPYFEIECKNCKIYTHPYIYIHTYIYTHTYIHTCTFSETCQKDHLSQAWGSFISLSALIGDKNSHEQATGLDAWASRVKCPARFVSHLHDICIYMSCL